MRSLFLWSLCALNLFSSAHAFPTFSSSNGTAVFTSAFGGDVVLAPDAAGTVIARSLLSAEGGIAFNATRLDEAFVAGLLERLAMLEAKVGLLDSLVVSPPPPPPSPSPPPPAPLPPGLAAGAGWANARLKSVASGLCWTPQPSPVGGELMVLMQECTLANQAISLDTVSSVNGYGTNLALTTTYAPASSQWQMDLGGSSAVIGAPSWESGGGCARFVPFQIPGSCAMFWQVIANGLIQFNNGCYWGLVSNRCISANGPLFAGSGSPQSVTMAACDPSDPFQQWTTA